MFGIQKSVLSKCSAVDLQDDRLGVHAGVAFRQVSACDSYIPLYQVACFCTLSDDNAFIKHMQQC